MMSVESAMHAHGINQRINFMETVRVTSRSLMAYQYVCTLPQ